MESSVLSPADFFQLTIDSLLKLCTHCIDGHCIVSIEGRLLLTLDTGDKVDLNIFQDDIGSLSKVEDANEYFSVCFYFLSLYYCRNLFISVIHFDAVSFVPLVFMQSQVLEPRGPVEQ